MADALSRLPLNGNQETTQESTYKKKIVSEINDTKEIPEGVFNLILKRSTKINGKTPVYWLNINKVRTKKGYFHGGSIIYPNLIMCEDKVVIPSILQSYVLHWYHTYILHPRMDRTEAMIFQHLYWPGIREAIRKEVTNCDTCQHKKR